MKPKKDLLQELAKALSYVYWKGEGMIDHESTLKEELESGRNIGDWENFIEEAKEIINIFSLKE